MPLTIETARMGDMPEPPANNPIDDDPPPDDEPVGAEAEFHQALADAERALGAAERSLGVDVLNLAETCELIVAATAHTHAAIRAMWDAMEDANG